MRDGLAGKPLFPLAFLPTKLMVCMEVQQADLGGGRGGVAKRLFDRDIQLTRWSNSWLGILQPLCTNHCCMLRYLSRSLKSKGSLHLPYVL